MKIVINTCFGGFSVSKIVCDMLDITDEYNVKRDDPKLIAVIEEIGPKAASGMCADLEIIEIPDGVDWIIENDDGKEWVSEKHRRWESERHGE